MNGLENFIYIGLLVLVLFVVTSALLKRFSPQKSNVYIRIIFMSLIFLSIGTIVIGIFIIGRWDGVGYAFIGGSILIGTILGFLISYMIKLNKSG